MKLDFLEKLVSSWRHGRVMPEPHAVKGEWQPPRCPALSLEGQQCYGPSGHPNRHHAGAVRWTTMVIDGDPLATTIRRVLELHESDVAWGVGRWLDLSDGEIYDLAVEIASAVRETR